MKRRNFSLACAAVAGASWVATEAQAQLKPPVAGTDYLVLDKRALVEAPAGKIEVVEFFWYNCPHCNVFEPAFDAWRKTAPKDLAVRRVPIAFQDDFAPQQRLYYALEAMGLVAKLHAKVFAAIHVEKLSLNKPDAITAWVTQQGVDKTKFLAEFNSFATASKTARATQLQNAYKVEGVPSLGVAGRFYTDGTQAGSLERALKVVEFLATVVRSGR
jgi:thiol:disulfide interchange protein DsbA